MNKSLLQLLFVLLLTGCSIFHKPIGLQAPIVQAVPLQRATSAVDTSIQSSDEASKQVKAIEALKESKAVSAIADAKTNNSLNPKGNPKTIVDMDLSLALGIFADVQADPEMALALSQNNALVQQGKAEAALAANNTLASNVAALNTALAAQKAAEAAEIAKRDQALKDQQIQQDAFIQKTNENQTAADKALADEKAKESQIEQDKQALYLNIAGGVFLLIFGLGVGFGQLAGLKIVYPFGILSLMCLGLAQIITQWWFKYGVLGATLLLLIVVGVWFYQHYQKGNLLQATQAQATKLQTTLSQVVPVIDNAYNNADTATQKVLDDTVFNNLSTSMTKDAKSVIHLVRAAL
jgi:hypothetical protein